MAGWATTTVAAGESLWRHHNSVFPPDQLRPAHPNPAGRFDCPDPSGWASSYYSGTTQASFGETLLRDVGPGAIVVPARRLSGTAVSRVVATSGLELVDLRGAAGWAPLDNQVELVGFPTPSDPGLYERSRAAAARIHDEAPDTDGLCWLSVRNPQHASILLWSDTPTAQLTTAESVALTEAHDSAVASMLTSWAAILMRGDEHVEPDDVAAGLLGWTR